MTQDIQAASAVESKIERVPTITDITWGKGFNYGAGIDAITGSLMVTTS